MGIIEICGDIGSYLNMAGIHWMFSSKLRGLVLKLRSDLLSCTASVLVLPQYVVKPGCPQLAQVPVPFTLCALR